MVDLCVTRSNSTKCKKNYLTNLILNFLTYVRSLIRCFFRLSDIALAKINNCYFM